MIPLSFLAFFFDFKENFLIFIHRNNCMNKIYDKHSSLISGLKDGDESAYSYLVERYHHPLCVYASSLILDDLAAEDIVQNVFIKIWKKKHKLKDDFSLNNFLYRSVHNEFIDQYRKNKSVVALEKKYIDALTTLVEEEKELFSETRMTAIDKAIEELPSKCKRIFILSKKEGLTNFEISEHLNISIKTVEGQITKAFNILRAKLEMKYRVMCFVLMARVL